MRRAICAIFIILLVISTGSLFAASYLSNGSGNWGTPTIWTPNGTPGTGDDVTIQNGHIIVTSNPSQDCRNLIIDTGGKLYANLVPDATNMKFVNVWGSITCNGTIGNGTTDDAISFNLEGVAITIGGTGTFKACMIRKITNTNLYPVVTIAMNVTLTYGTSTFTSQTAFYNNGLYTHFDVTINAGCTLDCSVNPYSCVCLNGATPNTSYVGGSLTINGTLKVGNILYLYNRCPHGYYTTSLIINNGGVVEAKKINCSASSAATHILTINSGGILRILDSCTSVPSSTGNTYNINSGSTVEYAKAGATSVYRFGNSNYSNLIVSNGGPKTLNTSTYVDNSLVLNGGDLSLGATTLVLNGCSLTQNSGTLLSGTSGSLWVQGTGSNISLPALALTNFKLDRANGVTLEGALSIGGTFTATSGTMTLGNYNLTVSGTLTGTPNLIYNGRGVATGITNPVLKVTTISPISLPNSIATLTVEPGVGNTVILPTSISTDNLIFTNGSLNLNSKTLTLSGKDIAFDGANSISALSVTEYPAPADYNDGTHSISRRWYIGGSSSGSIQITLSWPSSADNGMDLSRGCHLWSYNGSDWIFINSITVNLTNPRTAAFTKTLGTKDSNGEFTISGNDETLPVELSSFTTVLTSDYFVRLDWSTQSETGVAGYYIYRNTRNDLNTAERINTIIPATNTSSQENYSYTDLEVGTGSWYYWLQNLDVNGEFSFYGPSTIYVTNPFTDHETPVISVTTGLKNVFPNPFVSMTMIQYFLTKSADVTISVYNLKGEYVCNLISKHSDMGNYRTSWDGMDENGKSVSSGVYFIRMVAGRSTFAQKVLLLK